MNRVTDASHARIMARKCHTDGASPLGCSCEQIIDAQGLGGGHAKHGCSISVMDDWVELVTP